MTMAKASIHTAWEMVMIMMMRMVMLSVQLGPILSDSMDQLSPHFMILSGFFQWFMASVGFGDV